MNMRKLIAVTAVVAGAMLPSYADRTVAITAYDDATREVSLAFGGTSAAAENVYIAYGPADCGGHFHAWPNRVNVGTIATDATSMTCELPAAITTGVYYRFFVGDKPYDAEVEYIKGDKTSWIRTTYVPSSTNRVETKIYFDSYSTGNAGIEAIYSARNTSSKKTFTAFQYGGNLRIDRKDSTDQQSTTLKIPTLTGYTLAIDYSAETVTTNLTSACGMKTASAGAYTAGGYLALFTINGQGFNLTDSTPISRGGGFRMYWFKMYDTSTGNLDLDLIPVIVNGSPCMYDRVSGNVLPRCGEAGGGFTAGRELSLAVASSQTCRFGTLAADVDYASGAVTLSFPELDADADVWVVYSTGADAGAFAPNGWAHYVKAASVTAGATSASFTVDDLAGASSAYYYKVMRFVLARKTEKTTPFDYQVEYIHATSGNYVDTGIVPNCTDSAAAKVNIRQYLTSPIWSSRYASSTRTMTVFAHSGKYFRFDRYNSYATQSGTFSLNKDYVLEADYKTRIYNVIGEISGSKTGLIANAGDFTPDCPFLLFAANNSGSVGGDSNCDLYWFTLQLWDGSLRRDLMPVVKDGSAYLYDTVTDSLMTQTGSFTAGARTAKRYGMDALMASAPCADSRTIAYARFVDVATPPAAPQYEWRFYSSTFQEVANPGVTVPDETLTVLFGSAAELSALLADRTASGWTAGGYKMTDFTVASDGYTFPAGFDFTPLEGLTLDLAGHGFTLPAAMRDANASFSVTDSSAAGSGGTLFFDVGDGMEYANERITLSGSLEFVKTGAGAFTAAKTGQTYTGGTAVSNGVFTVGGNGDTGVLGAGGALTVGVGATVEMNGTINFLDHPLVLAGGTLANSGKKSNNADVVPTTDSTFSNICLTATSTIRINKRYGFSNQQGDRRVRLELGGNVFHCVCDTPDSSVFFDLKDVTVENGTIKTGMNDFNFSLRGDCIATNNVTFDVGSKFPLIGSSDTSVKLLNFINRVPAANYEYRDNDALTVYGVFKPITPYWHGLTMVDGATLDLSETEGVFSVVTKLQNATNLRFADGATITIALTNRADLAAIAASNAPYIVTWPSTNLAPANVTFQLDVETAAAGYAIAQDEYGIVLADAAAQATPVYAKMVKGEGDEYSWHFYNTLWNDITATAGVAVPNSGITVWFGSGAELAAIDADRTANGWTAKGYHTTGFDVPSDGCGVSSAAANLVISENATIDLKGHAFTLPESLLTADAKFTVTDSSPDGEGGTLTVVVADSATVFDNYNISFTGSLLFVKDGEGTFTERKNGHTYTGDVTIKGGWLRTVGHGTDGVIGAPCTVTVEEGGTLDICGRIFFGGFNFVLAGGTFVNCNHYNTSFDANTSITNLRLTKDSVINLQKTRYGMYAAGERTYLDLGGHTLSITNSQYFDLVNTTIENGTIEIFGSGNTSTLLPRQTVIATNNVTFIIHNNINFFGDVDKYTELANYVAMEDNIGIQGSSADVLHIWGSFVPRSAKYHGLTMMDGSTLDLSYLAEPLAACSTGGTTAHGHSLLKFADNATIYVKVGERPLHKGDYLVTWTSASKPANLATVKFKCAGGRSFRVAVDDDGEGNGGLRFIPSGMMIIVR